MGKGDGARVRLITRTEWEANYERTFGKALEEKNEIDATAHTWPIDDATAARAEQYVKDMTAALEGDDVT